jgi:antitoxin PrlF
MPHFVSSVSPKGQITIPLEIRKRFGIKPRDKVAFEIEGDSVKIAPVSFTLETAFGSVTPINRPEDFKELARQAKEEHANEVVREMREG